MMNGMMDWMMGGMGIVSLLVIIVLVLAAAACPTFAALSNLPRKVGQ